MSEGSARNRGSIMAVDDQPANLKLLESMLVNEGYHVRSFPRGRLALAAAAQKPPDLILLDINMPEMNGYEVCQQLKADSKLSRIPVLFLSALCETEDKVKALRSGGADYITKPFQFDEVHARVETHLKVHSLQRALQLQNEDLERAVAARTRELAEAHERLKLLDRSKSEFLSLISHELRTPLNGLLGVGGLILGELSSTPENNELREMFEQSRERIIALIEDALLLTQIDVKGDKFAPVPLRLDSILTAAIGRAAAFARSRGVPLPPAPAVDGQVLGIPELLTKALQALVETAVQYSGAGEAVGLECRIIANGIQIIIQGRGSTIPDAALPKFFDTISMSEASSGGGDIGLRPAIAFRILALFGGSVVVENETPAGIRLTLMLRAR